MHGELDCVGRIQLGDLPDSTRERLAGIQGNWLEYSRTDNTIVVRHAQPAGCPALSGVTCELMAMMDLLPHQAREAMPGGVLYLNDRHGGIVLRIMIQKGEVRVQWPHPDYAKAFVVPADQMMSEVLAPEARIRGWARFAGTSDEVRRLQECLDRFEGLYDEGDLSPVVTGRTVFVEFIDVNMGPKELVAKLKEISLPPQSLEAELDVGSFVPDSKTHDFRVRIRHGIVEAFRPSLWE